MAPVATCSCLHGDDSHLNIDVVIVATWFFFLVKFFGSLLFIHTAKPVLLFAPGSVPRD